MPQPSDFNGAITAHTVIAGSSFETGATMNNYFSPVVQGRSSSGAKQTSTSSLTPMRRWTEPTTRAFLDRPVCPGP